MMRPSQLLLLAAVLGSSHAVLEPPSMNVAQGRQIQATSTCGEVNGQPVREMFCTIAGASPYSPMSQYSYSMVDDTKRLREARMEHSIVQGGQNCDFCEANSSQAHPASNMVDGTHAWWQSPPLSRGMKYNEVNITLDLGQAFHIVYVWIQMANSPRPGTWILERSKDFGKTWEPWQYFATSPAECTRLYGIASLSPVTDDDSVICTSDYSAIQPMDNGEVMVSLLENRPGKHAFSMSPKLRDFTLATNVRIRLLRVKTLQGHLMDLNDRNDPTVTRRYFYSFKELILAGRCVCNGHAPSCDVSDTSRKDAWICKCEHNTTGDNCERCMPGYEQKKWRKSSEGDDFECEPCNCHGHSLDCEYDEEVDRQGLSLDIHGNYEGGGRCTNCQHNTQGINCNECVHGYYRPYGKVWNETDVCEPCSCDPTKHTGNCADETGICECLPQFTGPNCDQCAQGYYHPPECRPCECNVNGTQGSICLPINGKCPCKAGYGGMYCEQCAAGYTNITAGCVPCACDNEGSLHQDCDVNTTQCVCKSNYGGLKCDECAKGYFNHPMCEFCDCDPGGTEDEVCDKGSGQCLCKPGFAGRRCDQCDERFYGYPNCRECSCDAAGSKTTECDPVTGECPCYANFTGRTCDKCAAGYYRYPECLVCGCNQAGSKGLTCDNDGQCYCKENFQGKQCDRCKDKLYNFPICEECNCHPSGVVPEFAGCDKVAPGELCTCRANVQGRTCSQCKPTFWDLQPYHLDGCIDCACNMTGTISLLNSCDQQNGQCACKRHVGGRKCDECAPGFYQMEGFNELGCQACNCDAGGSIGTGCNQHTGQCHCRPRIEGLNCDKPIKDHFFPTLWQHRYEAEDGRLPDGKPVRFAIDEAQFPNFSWRGYTVFSPIQDEIILEVDIKRASVYKLLFHYINPTEVPVDVDVKFVPARTQTTDHEQKGKVVFSPNEEPTTTVVNEAKPFVLNPGRWNLHISSPKRLFLDYVVLIPEEYFEGSSLRQHVNSPCLAHGDSEEHCLDLVYSPMPASITVDASDPGRFKVIDITGASTTAPLVPPEQLPDSIGQAVRVLTDDHSRDIQVEIEVPEDDMYHLLVEYHHLNNISVPVKVRVEQGDIVAAEGTVLINHCPYATFCRTLVAAGGRAALLGLQKSPPNAVVTFTVRPENDFGIAGVTLVKQDLWRNNFLGQVAICVRKDGKCIGQPYPQPPNSIITEAESGKNVNNSIAADKLPFEIHDGKTVKVMSLDNVQSTIDVNGVVPSRGHYIFVVHYFNPDNPPLDVDVLFQGESFADAHFPYCPSVTGCRTIIVDRQNPDQKHFFVEDKYSLTFYHNTSQRGPIYIDSVTAVPYESFTEALLRPLPIDLSQEFVEHCSDNNYENAPKNVSDFCRGKIFSLTAEFNKAALSCDCNPLGATDFSCEEYGGVCKCKPNVIGRTCDRCAPGFHGFPECIKCRCGPHQQCDEQTGQCFCPRYVEGTQCDKCVPYAYGYDPLIGCQLCGCHQNGSYGGALQCDPLNGQCLCKANVGGRQCDKCLPGFYRFPHCDACNCNVQGTTEDVCDAQSAKCLCKRNVVGTDCNTCRAGTFDLRKSDPDGCSECFCFGVTERCRSSDYPVQTFSFDDQSWKSDDPHGTVVGRSGRIEYTSVDNADLIPENVYLQAPLLPNADYTASYGLHVSFIVSSTPNDEKPKISSAADLRLISGATVLEYWATEQPSDPSQPFKVVATLLPEFWLQESGEPVTRPQLMMALFNVDKLLIKASYYEKPKSAALEQFEVEMAQQHAPSANAFIRAPSVEVCQCPASYTGPSCQYCAAGHYRVKSGNFLGSCVPCNCHGHSGTCDADTGICKECGHNTEGDHCERCVEGFYGNATTGSPYACLACPCPHPTATNNFAHSCIVGERGGLERCICKKGYAGTHCETCDVGFYGEPLRPGGYCETCFCNGNNDLTEEGACNPVTGDCALCRDNTDGRKCEICKQWHYGDAVLAKNCSECTCDQCGSVECDHRSGNCECKPLVEGRNCDRCAPNAWGFKDCAGCRECHCGVASSTEQCDLETGQCACLPGADGMRCDRCAHGYWDYGPQGCRKCDCEADLAKGTVCDVHTGQCHCQEGATGPRCDTCIATHLRIPTVGCRYCDECVRALNSEVDGYDIGLEVLEHTLSNISGVALTGARLKRVEKAFNELSPKIDAVVSMEFANELQSLTPQISAARDAAAQLAIRANRSLEQLVLRQEKLDDVYRKLAEIRVDANDLNSITNWVVEQIRHVTQRFETAVPVENREELITNAERLVGAIRENDDKLGIEQFTEKLEEVNRVLTDIEAVKNRSRGQSAHIKGMLDRVRGLRNTSDDFASEIRNAKLTTSKTRDLINSLRMFQLNALVEGVEKDSATLRNLIDTEALNYDKTRELLEFLHESNETIHADLQELKNLQVQLSPATDETTRRSRRAINVDKSRLHAHVAELEQKAKRLQDIYNRVVSTTENTVLASSVYKDVVEIIAQARNRTNIALIEAKSAQKLSSGRKELAALRRQESEKIRTDNDAANRDVKDAIDVQAAQIREKLNSVQSEIDRLNGELASVNATRGRPDVAEFDQVTSTSDAALVRVETINNDNVLNEALAASERVKKLSDVHSSVNQDSTSAQSQIKEIQEKLPATISSVTDLKARIDNTTAVVEELKGKLAYLKEKVAVARDKANRIKLGAHFEVGSVLELPVTAPVDDFGSYTDARLFFRTRRDTGLLLYFGNEARQSGVNEFIAVEVENRRPKLTFALGGREPASITLDTEVTDHHWREIVVERVGKDAIFKLTHPNSERFAEEKTVSVSGSKNVLNLYKDSMRLLLPPAVNQRHFVGDLDKLQVNGEHIGFWNSDKAEHITGADVRTVADSERQAESGVSFNGNGYMQLGVGAWNPRKRTAILLSFSTYTPDGLLFFMGKDRDQLVVELVDGRVSLSFDLGSGAVKLLSEKSNYNDGQWHMIGIDRMERRAKLEIDGADVQEGESPGTMFEMSVSDAFYLGGLPKNVQTRFTVQPFRGCLKNLKLDTEYIDLNNARYSKGVQSSCPTREVRLATLISERSQATLAKLSATKEVELSLRFRTQQSRAHIASVTSNEEDLLKIELDNGVLVVKSNGEETDVVRAEVPSDTEGRWHFVSVVRTKKQLKVHMDDVFTKKIEAADLSDLLSSDDITVTLGHDSATDKHFIGCVGDVVFNGKLTSFANYEHKELKLTGCGLADDGNAPTASTDAVTPEEEALEATAEPVRKLEPAASNVRPPGSCALPEVPYGEREDSAGMRFGLVQGSRLEYDRPPDSFDRNIVFSVQLRATAANGIIMFVTNEKHSDYIALYMIEGRIGFSVGSGTSKLTILSKRSVLDDEWHTIRAEREGAAAALFIDGHTEAESRVEGTETVDALAPLYIGGLPTDLLPLSSNILPGIKSEFGGCLREFKLNDKKFDDTAREHGVVPCSQYTENGLYFGKEGGYAILQQEFVVGTSFAFEMEVKPRTKNAVLLSVGVLEFVTLQILNGTIKFSVDSGGGTESVVYVPPAENAICDGHWHQIKLNKKKNLITLNVDGKSNLRIMKTKTETSTKDPLYLGGIPKDVKRRGLDTVDPYIGCVRVLSIGKKTRRRRRNVDLSSIELFGMTDRSSCPLN